ncbi:hypothetical protein AAGW05_12810 [Arthrobacter sp. LAPM80]
MENCQIGVFLSYAAPAGRTSLNRDLDLPKAWMDDPARCKRADIAEDSVYGQHAGLRCPLEARGMHYVIAEPMNQRAITPDPWPGAPSKTPRTWPTSSAAPPRTSP